MDHFSEAVEKLNEKQNRKKNIENGRRQDRAHHLIKEIETLTGQADDCLSSHLLIPKDMFTGKSDATEFDGINVCLSAIIFLIKK